MHRLLILAVIGIPISACSTTKYVATSAPFCSAIKTVCINKADVLTESTASQVEGNNLARGKLCKVRVMCKPPKP